MSDEDGHPEVGSVAEEAAKLFGALASGAHGLGQGMGEHLTTDSADCQWCPLCRGIHVVRELSPEVRDHLGSAAASLMQATAALLSSQAPNSSAATQGFEKIDLEEDDS